ncbi:shikimate dehydrogenase family protein [Terriglobus roseus]|uniref:Shikimate dehydrogenase n=1 Tax=Terriglobus roseus TaxID=392734 RepID=A0A1H4SDT7_9BACT|nr:shikimate dehydrogenase [Terriglobus roseus]SEC42289.1 shikimate dehydrogenase [Terriglobus roseus]
MFESLSGETHLYPILGDPIGFVKSPQRLTAKFAERHHNGACVPMLVPEGTLGDLLRGLAPVSNVRGLLVTMPHKGTMFQHCATFSETSKLLGVVSIVRRNDDGSWHGDMLDGLAFVEAQKKAGAKIEGARVLQIGAGAAGSAIAAALLDAGTRELILHDVDTEKAEGLVRLLARRGHLASGRPDPTGFDLVINTTPMGMHAEDPLPVSSKLLTASMFVGDVVAGHGQTPLLKAAQAVGCKTADGSGMVDAGLDLMLDFLLGRR